MGLYGGEELNGIDNHERNNGDQLLKLSVDKWETEGVSIVSIHVCVNFKLVDSIGGLEERVWFPSFVLLLSCFQKTNQYAKKFTELIKKASTN